MRLRTLFQTVFGWRILSGPFAGMHYVGEYAGSLLAPKLLGTYERELHAVVNRLCAAPPLRVVNVGAGEGYYAVGLARRLPRCQIHAFEASEHGRVLLAQVAARNRVESRIRISGLCTPADLVANLSISGGDWLVMDVEGAEDILLDPVLVPALSNTHILVEVHDFIDPELGARLQKRFASSHTQEEIRAQPRSLSQMPGFLRWLALTPWRKRVLHALDEQRPSGMRWFVFIPLKP